MRRHPLPRLARRPDGAREQPREGPRELPVRVPLTESETIRRAPREGQHPRTVEPKPPGTAAPAQTTPRNFRGRSLDGPPITW
jgi:hypothetical protein